MVRDNKLLLALVTIFCYKLVMEALEQFISMSMCVCNPLRLISRYKTRQLSKRTEKYKKSTEIEAQTQTSAIVERGALGPRVRRMDRSMGLCLTLNLRTPSSSCFFLDKLRVRTCTNPSAYTICISFSIILFLHLLLYLIAPHTVSLCLTFALAVSGSGGCDVVNVSAFFFVVVFTRKSRHTLHNM